MDQDLDQPATKRDLLRLDVSLRADFKADIKKLEDLITDFRNTVLKLFADFAAKVQTLSRREIINSHRLDALDKRVNS